MLKSNAYKSLHWGSYLVVISCEIYVTSLQPVLYISSEMNHKFRILCVLWLWFFCAKIISKGNSSIVSLCTSNVIQSLKIWIVFWRKLELIQALMLVLVTWKYQKDPIKKKQRKSGNTIFPIISLWGYFLTERCHILKLLCFEIN